MKLFIHVVEIGLVVATVRVIFGKNVSPRIAWMLSAMGLAALLIDVAGPSGNTSSGHDYQIFRQVGLDVLQGVNPYEPERFATPVWKSAACVHPLRPLRHDARDNRPAALGGVQCGRVPLTWSACVPNSMCKRNGTSRHAILECKSPCSPSRWPSRSQAATGLTLDSSEFSLP